MKSLPAEPSGSASPLIQATAHSLPEQAQALSRARAFAEPLLAGEALDTGENTLAHADAVAAILKLIGGSEAMQAASYLVYACEHLNKPQEVIAKAFGDNFATLALETTKLVRLQRQARQVQAAGARTTSLKQLARVSFEPESVVGGPHGSARYVLHVTRWENGQRSEAMLADVDPHGRKLTWLA